MKVWFTASEIASLILPNLPTTDRAVQIKAKKEKWQELSDAAANPLARKRKGRGGGWEYHYTLFPLRAQAKLVHEKGTGIQCPKKVDKKHRTKSELWAFFDTLTDKRKAKAEECLRILSAVKVLQKGGWKKDQAVQVVATQNRIGTSTIYNWFDKVAGYDRQDWLPVLAPHHAGRAASKKCHPDAWDMLCADYLRAERPTFESCFRRMKSAAEENGWSIPSNRTLERHMDNEFTAVEQKLARYGLDAVKAMFPTQERDKSVFHALEAVNADGHKFDVWVKFPDGEVLRPMMTAFQDIYSGLYLSWRVDKSENKEAVRLAFGDVVETYGIPEIVYLDNGRSFASKWLTGGTANRYRFKIKPEDPVGIMTQLGLEIHWTTPYSGQSKPIERGFKDFCDNISKHPAFAGAWTGNTPLNKPENYGSKAVPLEKFLKIVEEGIREHNNRSGRLANICNGRSFQETFEESYERSPIRIAEPEQRRLWLLAAEGVRAARRDGALKLMDNRYWAEFLQNHLGNPLVVRFDPQNLHDGVHVYRLDGGYLGYAEIIEAKGFNDVNAAREHNRNRRSYLRGVRDSLEAKRRMEISEVADLIPDQPEASPMEAHVVRPIFNHPVQATREAPKSTPMSESEAQTHETIIADLSEHRPMPKEETKVDRFWKAMALQESLEARHPVEADDKRWLDSYLTTSEFKTQKTMFDDFGEAALMG